MTDIVRLGIIGLGTEGGMYARFISAGRIKATPGFPTFIDI